MKEICVHLGVSRDTISKWINQKKIPAHKIWKFSTSAVDERMKNIRKINRRQENRIV